MSDGSGDVTGTAVGGGGDREVTTVSSVGALLSGFATAIAGEVPFGGETADVVGAPE